MKSLRQQCTAHRSNGEPCKRWAINGGTVCATHGGRAPQVKAKAAERLKALEHPAIDKMTKLIDSESDQVAFQVCKDILDRAGHKPADKIELTGETLQELVTRRRQRLAGEAPKS